MATNITTGLLKNLSSDNTSDYDMNYEDERCDTSGPRQVGTYVTVVVFSIVILLSLFGNILVMVILVKYENIKSLSNVLIMNLAVSDLFFTIGLPLWIHSHMNEWTLGEPACKMVMFVFFVGYYSSSILLVLMTAHRYIAVMRPLSSIMSNKGFCSALASPVIWVVSLIFAVPALIFTSVLQNNRCVTVRSIWNLFGIYQQNFFFFLNSVVFLFCYPQIICRLLRPTAQRRKSKTLKLIFILMVVFLVTWAPYNIVIFLKSFQFYPNSHDASTLQEKCNFTKRLEYAFYISRLFAFSQCCLNPVFYVFVGVKFKKHLKKMLKSWGRKSSSNSLQGKHSRLTVTSVTSGEESTV
ncbi:hypothetical protein fugu_014640 [Takifugu bimaculatus]|uniref:G-protein coupled receptors family 1 profile domain-containing protein n=1 Tax=Takifugu bimaculatus TaxID=433685 RepID=A0A4Z2C214_9TELE|nr:hypothetical protein fugu_014640 [Takifugu bimaculatus]